MTQPYKMCIYPLNVMLCKHKFRFTVKDKSIYLAVIHECAKMQPCLDT